MPLEITRIKALCFDVDGTLSDTDDQFVLKLVKWLSPMHLICPNYDVMRTARRLVMLTEGPGNWVYGMADRLGLDDKIVALGDRLYQLGLGKSEKPFQLIQGVDEMLDGLRHYYTLSIISIRGQRATLRFLHQFELHPYFKVVVTGQTCTHTKPYPDPILWAASQMGVTADTCLMVGDTAADIQSGKKAGAQTVGVLCGFGDRQELERAGADLILETTTDLSGIFLGG
jgi:phosphoglycolate phosphatase-like HAD superfamily hydrolase